MNSHHFLAGTMEITISDDGIVSFEETKILKQVTLADFVDNLKSIKPLSTGFLPNGCILYHREGAKSTYVFEETPQIRVLNWMHRSTNTVTPYPISMPFIYWILKVQDKNVVSIRGRASMVPVRDMNQKLLCMGLPNFYDGGQGEMCRGSTRVTLGDNIHSSIRKAVNDLWDTNWNGDLSVDLPGPRDFEDWAEKTIVDPLYWTKLKHEPCRTNWDTFGGLIESD